MELTALQHGQGMIEKSKQVISRIVDGEAIILDTDTGYYFSLNWTGTDIWTMIEEGKTIGEVSSIMAARHGIEPEIIRRDVEELVADLKKQQLVGDCE